MKTFDELFDELSAKVSAGDPSSGTVAAVRDGVHAAGKKVVEEAAESWMAAEHEGPERTAEELSQLLYQVQVLMLATGLRLDDQIQQFTGARLSDEILRTMRRAQEALAERVAAAVDETGGAEAEQGRAVLRSLTRRLSEGPDAVAPEAPVMPAAPSLTFRNTPTLPHQLPGNGFESGRDSRAR